MPGKDRELDAITSIMALLKPLNETERSRVLEYVLKRLEMAMVQAPAVSQIDLAVPETSSPGAGRVIDIRTLTAEKQPRSANEMVALVAYYVSELAPPSDRANTVNQDTIRKYFKMAGFPLPSSLRSVLPNASAAGYLQNVSRGEYRLNPVGYNLVVHNLPGSSRPGPASKTRKRRQSRTSKVRRAR